MSRTYRGSTIPSAGTTVVAKAEDVTIRDDNSLYIGTNVEDALQEVYSAINASNNDIQYTDISTATYSMTAASLVYGHNFHGVDYAGAVTITLPATVDEENIIIIKDESGAASTNNITINASATIDGSASATIDTDYGAVVLYFDGTSYFNISSIYHNDHGRMLGLADDDHPQYHTDSRALTWLGTRSTTDLTEGTNLYYTDERVDDRASALIQNGTGISWAYNDTLGTLTGTVSLSPFSTTNLSEGTNLYYTQARFDTAFSGKSTTDLSEGTNLYFTNERVDDRAAALIQNGTGLTWTYNDVANTLTGVVSLTPFSTTNLSEGTNLYYTTTRANTAIDARVTKAFVDALNVDADTLDSLDSTQFLRSDVADIKTAGNLTLNDNVQLHLGTSDDMLIYHDTVDSRISNTTGNLILSNLVNSSVVRINANNSLGTTKKTAEFGGTTPYVRLYYDGTMMLETADIGVRVPDNTYYLAGTGNDLQLYHDGAGSFIRNNTGNLVIDELTNGGSIFIRTDDSVGVQKNSIIAGGTTPYVRLYYDGNERFRTGSEHVSVIGTATGNANLSYMAYYDSTGTDRQGYVGFGSNTSSDLYVQNDRSSGLIRIHADNSAGANKICALFGADTPYVRLYYDGINRFETTASGVKVNGHLQVDDNNQLRAGTGNDLQIYHDSANSYIKNITGNLLIRNEINSGLIDLVTYSSGGAPQTGISIGGTTPYVRLYHNNVQKFNTESDGVSVGISGGLTDNYIHFWGSAVNSIIKNEVNSGLTYIQNDDGAGNPTTCGIFGGATPYVRLYYGGLERLSTTTSGISVTGNLACNSLYPTGIVKVNDNQFIYAGTGNDLQLYHTGSNSYLDNITGALVLRNFDNSQTVQIATDDSGGVQHTCAIFGGATPYARLYYDNVLTLETTSTGAKVTGDLEVTGSVTGGGIEGYAGVMMYPSSDLTLTSSGTWYQVTGVTEIWDEHDTGAWHSTGGNIVIPSGVTRVEVSTHMRFSNETTIHKVGVFINGTLHQVGSWDCIGENYGGEVYLASVPVNVTVGQTLTIRVQNQSASGDTLQGAINPSSFIHVKKIA